MLQECLPVITNARKLIARVPQTSKKAAFPENAVISGYGQNNNQPNIVVYNVIDNGGTWQGADENGIVIINSVTELDAEKLLENYDFTIAGLEALIRLANKFGYRDIYTTTVDFARTKFSPAGRMLDSFTGLVKRDDRDITYIYREGDKIMVQADLSRHIEPEILQRDYRNVDGSQISLSQIP
jgi:hypothetical protein